MIIVCLLNCTQKNYKSLFSHEKILQKISLLGAFLLSLARSLVRKSPVTLNTLSASMEVGGTTFTQLSAGLVMASPTWPKFHAASIGNARGFSHEASEICGDIQGRRVWWTSINDRGKFPRFLQTAVYILEKLQNSS